MKHRIGLGLLAAAPFALALAHCDSGTTAQCTIGSDCASGACLGNGTCAPVSSTQPEGGGPADSGTVKPPPTDGSTPDGQTDSGTMPPPEDAGGCLPDDSGMITRAQVFLQAGLHATFRTADNVTVSTAGTTQPDGSRTWDYSGALTGDQDVLVQTLPVTGAWYATSYPGAGYASQLSHTEPLFGVFTAGDTALVLDGVVSQTSGTTQTELSYNPPATTLAFPIAMGATWQSTSSITGTASGIPSVYTEEYQSVVDAHGTLVVPFGTFPVLRVATLLTRTVGLYATYTESFLFVTPCFGTVASITAAASQTNPMMGEFTSVSEIQRLAP
jgi:hypothetical protein